jgi:short-subunit dehydrogenase
MISYANQMVLITGAATGIGRQLALEFARRGASIGAIDLTAEPLQLLMKDLEEAGATGKAGWAVADVSDRSTMHVGIAKLESELGPTEVIVANAGIGDENPILGFRADIFARQVSVNLIGVANTLEPVLPGFIERRRGHIIALSSLASYRGLPHMAGYCASKAGVSSFMDSLRVELHDYGVHCTTICPGFIRTNMTKDLGVPTPGIMSVEDAVKRMMSAIEQRKAYLAFPAGNYFQLFLSRVMPTSVGDYLTRLRMGKVMSERAKP